MQVTRPTFIPLLAAGIPDRLDPGVVREEFCGDLNVVYTFGPQFGRRVVTHADLEHLEMPPRVLRRAAHEHLEVLAGRAEFHGQPPALMLSFEGLESSLLLATDFWSRLAGSVPGELVVGVPARDVVIVTGSQSSAGLEKARRCVERVFFAGDEHLLSRTLLVRRGPGWEPFDRPAAARHNRAHAAHRGEGPPRQYQEHPSWPGERVPVARPAERVPVGRPVHHTGAMPVAMPLHQTGSWPMAANAQVSGAPRAGAGMRPPIAGGTGSMPVVPVPRTPSGGPGGVAPYSAVPYSSVPYSGVPYSAVPYSAAPYSAAPYSPYGGPAANYLHSRGAQAAPPQQYAQPKPPYHDDIYSAGYDPNDPEYPADRPTYPSMWGSTPEIVRHEWRTGPRARFSR